jgi:hypothetical protein
MPTAGFRAANPLSAQLLNRGDGADILGACLIIAKVMRQV